jgi:hypothetical protein
VLVLRVLGCADAAPAGVYFSGRSSRAFTNAAISFITPRVNNYRHVRCARRVLATLALRFCHLVTAQ